MNRNVPPTSTPATPALPAGQAPPTFPTAADVIAFLLETDALRFGDFTLKSGARSPFFIDLGHVRTGSQLDRLGGMLADAAVTRFPTARVLFGPAYKGIALATATAVACWQRHRLDLPVLYDRKEAKGHGEGGQFIGHAPAATDAVLLLDDVLTSGATKRDAIARLHGAFGTTEVGILVVVDRRSRRAAAHDALPFCSLLRVEELAHHLATCGDPRAEAIRRWWEEAA